MLAEQIKPSTPPTAYVVEQHQQQCCNCFRGHGFSVVMARHTTSSNSSRLIIVTRTSDIMWNVPIERRIVPLEKIPFCYECLEDVTLGHLRTPPRLVELRTPLHTPQPSVSPEGRERLRQAAAKAPKRICTVDDL